MGLTYFTGFPIQTDSLGSTQAKFLSNTANVQTYLKNNHYDFGDILWGNHKWVWYGRQSTFPDTTTPSNEAIATYAKTDGVRTQLWFQPSNDATGATAIQLTAGDVTNAAFSTNTNYAPIVAGQDGGFSFLPGNLLIQYGKFTTGAASGTVVFPIAYSANPYSITTTSIVISGDSLSATTYEPLSSAIADTGFGWRKSGSHANGFFWVAIGKA